jgi:phage I-like protein
MPRMKTRIAALAIEIAKANHNEIQLFPAGEFSAVDGRPDDVDGGRWVMTAELAASLVSAVDARATPLVIDYEHQTLYAAKNGQPAPAAGWFSQVEWRDGSGLWAVGVEWTDKAAAMIAAGEYKYISPVFLYNKRGEVTQLLHAALTNTPALDGMDAVMLAAASRLANLSTQTETTTVDEEYLAELLRSLRWMLNLPETSTPEDIKAELQKVVDYITQNQQKSGTAAASSLLDILTARDEQVASLSAQAYDPAKHIPVAAFTELQARYAALSQTSATQEVDTLIQAALSDGRLLPAQESWAKDYGQKDMAGFKDWLDKAPKLAALTQTQTKTFIPPKPEDKVNTASMSAEQLAICSAFGHDPAEIARQLED